MSFGFAGRLLVFCDYLCMPQPPVTAAHPNLICSSGYVGLTNRKPLDSWLMPDNGPSTQYSHDVSFAFN